MRKYLGQFNIVGNEKVYINNIISNKTNLNVVNELYVDSIVESEDFYTIHFPEEKTVVLLDGEVYSHDFNIPINNEEFLKEIVINFNSGNEEFIHEINGSFNLIIYNYKNNDLKIINDRFSTRPLYYFINKNIFIFSNRMSEVLKCIPSPPKLNQSAVIEFFQLQMVFNEKTFVQNISALKRASFNSVTSNNLRSKNYWKFSQNIDLNYNHKEYVKKLSELMKEIINFKTKEDKKYGILLSGGLDSRAILAADRNNKISEIYTLGDSYNIECEISEAIAKLKDKNFHFIQRDIDHYYNILAKSVEIGDGMYNYLNGHFIGHLDDINKEVDVIFNGSLIEQFWQGSKFIKKKVKIKKYKVSSPFLKMHNNKKNNIVIDNLPRKILGVEKIFNNKLDFDFEKNIEININDIIKENFGEKQINHQEAIDYLACDSYGRYSSHLNQLCINDKIKYRTIYDNRLIDMLLQVPIKHRTNGRLLKEAIKNLDSKFSEIPLSSSRIKLKRNSYFHWMSTLTLNIFLKLFQSNSYKSKNSSWPNYAKLIIENKKIQNKILDIINSEDVILNNLFDKKYLRKIFDEHINGEKNNERILFQLLTFGEWYYINFAGRNLE